MQVVVQGTNEFNDYNVFLRAMGVAMSGMNDNRLDIYSVGPANINSFVTQFVNLSENGMRARGKKVKQHLVPLSWAEENISSFDYVVFLCTPGQRGSKLTSAAELANIELGIFRY